MEAEDRGGGFLKVRRGAPEVRGSAARWLGQEVRPRVNKSTGMVAPIESEWNPEASKEASERRNGAWSTEWPVVWWRLVKAGQGRG